MDARASETEKETLQGTVVAVVFQNPENGYTVLRIRSTDGSHTLVGQTAEIAVGESVTARGVWEDHPSFGPQFKAEFIEAAVPTERGSIFAYLSSGIIKSLTPTMARRVVDLFGERALTVIESSPEELTKVKGMTRKKAQEIQQEFLQKAGMRRLVEFLAEYRLSSTLALPLWHRYGERAIDILRADPYLLLEEGLGLKFADVDRIAGANDIRADDLVRVQAGILYTLTHNLDNGHCFLPKDRLLPAAAKLLLVGEEDLLKEGLDALQSKGKVTITPVAGLDAVYRTDLYEDEMSIVERVTEMCQAELQVPEDIEQLIDQVQREQNLVYAPEQRDGVRMAAQRQIMLLTGGPGTGKTTSLRGILGLFERMGLRTLLCAPTGRAAKRLGELCQAEASTIHRLLGAEFDPDLGRAIFQKDEDSPLKCKAVIVDETSMVDVSLMAALLAALPNGCRLVLVGDADQLPSVGPGQVFEHLIRSGVVPTTRLTTIFRQAQASKIVMNAHSVNRGELPGLKNQGGDFFFLRRKDGQAAVDTIVELCQTRLPEHMGIPSDQIQVLSPTRKYLTGTANLNKALQQALNPPQPGRAERRHGSTVIRVGDRVMQIQNNYDIMWHDADGITGGTGVFNGDVGRITDILPDGSCVTVNFDGHLVDYEPDMLNELEMAYAMTVHKSQGSEYRAVILAAVSGAPMLLTRGVLYTAITRARELLVIVGDEDVVAKMVQNDRQARRYSGICSLLQAGGPQYE